MKHPSGLPGFNVPTLPTLRNRNGPQAGAAVPIGLKMGRRAPIRRHERRGLILPHPPTASVAPWGDSPSPSLRPRHHARPILPAPTEPQVPGRPETAGVLTDGMSIQRGLGRSHAGGGSQARATCVVRGGGEVTFAPNRMVHPTYVYSNESSRQDKSDFGVYHGESFH